ncbi:hypothetical protein CQA53_00205 [Helicobacter didelphidarum]|uniref:Uncharacterized protein n=1 Tax=Helicobacter didelphidarum TaxID=2040648 RepID=A0A3D8IQE1_9HELI|nr:hypothetical protein [Helicobacter didelphidarum]RDU67489.1 hypothetical protein CQA53_00205 [Helicobacter didelphidarum]
MKLLHKFLFVGIILQYIIPACYATNTESKNHSEYNSIQLQKNSYSQHEPKIQIKGDSLVIMDSSCESKNANSVLSSFKKQNISQANAHDDCESK